MINRRPENLSNFIKGDSILSNGHNASDRVARCVLDDALWWCTLFINARNSGSQRWQQQLQCVSGTWSKATHDFVPILRPKQSNCCCRWGFVCRFSAECCCLNQQQTQPKGSFAGHSLLNESWKSHGTLLWWMTLTAIAVILTNKFERYKTALTNKKIKLKTIYSPPKFLKGRFVFFLFKFLFVWSFMQNQKPANVRK